jgi:hypothetical protein
VAAGSVTFSVIVGAVPGVAGAVVVVVVVADILFFSLKLSGQWSVVSGQANQFFN